MNFVQILECCPKELYDVVSIIKFVINLIRWAIPIILIILCILDLAKIVTAGNVDDKLKKEVTNKVATRIIFAVIIFLVPTIVRLLFKLIPVVNEESKDTNAVGATWQTCWDADSSGESLTSATPTP